MLDLGNYEGKARAAVQLFWKSQKERIWKFEKNIDIRALIAAGENYSMKGFVDLALEIIQLNGLEDADIRFSHRLNSSLLCYCPTKRWDLLVFRKRKLVAALKFKSQAGPLFGDKCF